MSLLEVIHYTSGERHVIELKKNAVQLKKYVKKISKLYKTKPTNLRVIYQNKVVTELNTKIDVVPRNTNIPFRHANQLKKTGISNYVSVPTLSKDKVVYNFVIIKEGKVFDKISMENGSGTTTIDDVRNFLGENIDGEWDAFSMYFENFGRTQELLRSDYNRMKNDDNSVLLSTFLNSFLCSKTLIPVYLRSLGWKSPKFNCITVVVKGIVPQDTEPINIVVKTLTGKKIDVKIYKEQDVTDLKNMIQNLEGIPPDQQKHVYSGSILEEGVPFEEYGIENNAELYVILRLRGGGTGVSFVDVTKGITKETGWSKTAPVWRTVGSGLAIKGICANASCAAYEEIVYCTIGFQHFDLVHEAKEVKCPMCKNVFQAMTPGFSNCFWRISAVKKGESEVFSSPWTRTEDKFCKYDEQKSGKAIFDRLQVFVKPLMSNQTKYKAPISKECGICGKNMMDEYGLFRDKDIYQLKCSHTFHKKCIKEGRMQDDNKDSGLPIESCVICDEKIEQNEYPKIFQDELDGVNN